MIGLRKETNVAKFLIWRKEVIEAVFDIAPDRDLLLANQEYLNRHFSDGTFIAIIADVDGIDCGCGAVCLTEEMPSPDNLSGRCAYLMNIYVRQNFRNRGIAHSLVRRLIDEASALNCGKIYLETTPQARHVYQTLGFNDMPDLMKYYEEGNNSR